MIRSSSKRIVVDLPAPFGPEEAEDLATFDLQIELEKPASRAVVLGEALCAYRRVVIFAAFPPRQRMWPRSVASVEGRTRARGFADDRRAAAALRSPGTCIDDQSYAYGSDAGRGRRVRARPQ